MNAIPTNINGKDQLIVYIEYHDGFPHLVITTDTDLQGMSDWDFEKHCQWEEYMYYNPGGGGDLKKMYGPHLIDSYNGASIWVADMVVFDPKYPPINCTVLFEPIMLKGGRDGDTIDPFKFAYQEVLDIEYCEECHGYWHEEGCPYHHSKEEKE